MSEVTPPVAGSSTTVAGRGAAAPELQVTLLSAVLAACTAMFVVYHLIDHSPHVASSIWAPVVVFAGFIVAESVVFHVEYRREALTLTLAEAPLALCLILLDPVLGLALRLIADLIVSFAVVRPKWYKLVFNLSMHLFSLAVAYVIAGLVVAPFEWGEAALLGLIATLLAVSLLDLGLVIAAIALFEGGFLGKLHRELVGALPQQLMTAVTGTIVAALVVQWPSLSIAVLVPIAGVWNVLRVNGRTNQHLRDLEDLNQISSSITRSLHRSDIADVAVAEVSRLLRADRVTLRLFATEGGSSEVTSAIGVVLGRCPRSLDDPLWAPMLAGPAHLVDAHEVVGGRVDREQSEQLIVAPIRDDQGVVGVLLVGARVGVSDSFDDSDAGRAGAIADRLGLALRNAVLHEQIEREAWRDQLTGLPNRTRLERVLEDRLARTRRGSLAVLTIGLDRFRDINSTLGHALGDDVLRELARRLRLAVGVDEVVARVSGDEFALTVRVDCEGDALFIARGLQELLHAPLDIGGFAVSVNTSVGVVLGVGSTTDPALLLRRADMAMQWAKSNHSGVELFRDEMDKSSPERLSMLAELRTALEQQQFEVFYQPKLDLAVGQVVGVEALVRWNHPVRGIVAPGEFVQLAENTGLITALTDQVVRRTVASVRLLNDLGFRLEASVNLSTVDLLDDSVVVRVDRILDEAGVAPGLLTFEITETSLLADSARTISTVEALHRLGCRLSIDDFGTGFSSLSYLRTLPASELKIDRSFVANLLLDERDDVIVRSTIDLGHNLGMRVVAEGVEDASTLDRLRTLGCDAAQGYGLSRPLPLDRLLVWLNSCSFPVARARPGDELPAEREPSRVGVVRAIRSVS